MSYSKGVKNWILIGLVMVFFQVVIGGITRLTESGLSITEWNVISGSIPPLNSADWESEFELYKATPQYAEVFEGITMADFKFIYFWEFIHRFWARIMGFVFLIPFIFFVYTKKLDVVIIKKLGYVILLAMLAATFGWIMVASGLIDRPWVNAYKLSLHLCIAFGVYAALYFCYEHVIKRDYVSDITFKNRDLIIVISLLIIQIFLGGVMSGMKAGVLFPTWPLIGDEFFPSIIFNISEWSVYNFNNYDQNLFLPSLIHFVHRITAYALFIVVLYLFINYYRLISGSLKSAFNWFSLLLITQILVGIVTVLMCKGEVPVLWGTLHQGVALLLLTSYLHMYYVNRKILNIQSIE